MTLDLTAEEVRVLGALMEKRVLTPDVYPMTLNGLVTACNQSSSRLPVVAYTDSEVHAALSSLRARDLLRIVHPSSGSRATKYREVAGERWQLEPDEQAVLTVLLLRGPQSANELRTRTERLHGFETTTEVEQVLERLAARAEPLVVRVGRAAGQRDERWHHLMSGPVDVEAFALAMEPSPAPRADRVAEVEQRVASLEGEVAELRAMVARLAAELGVEPPPS